MPYPHLSKAPIKEAIIEILVDAQESQDISVVKALGAKIKDGYPTQASRNRFKHAIQGDLSGKMAVVDSKVSQEGIACNSSDKLQTVQFFRDGFSFHRLKPYTDWDTFSGEARRLWELYQSSTKPTAVRRIGLRFLNFIEAPFPLDVADVLVASIPQPVAGLAIGNFSTTVLVARHPENGPFANVIQTIQPGSEVASTLNLVLDIDAFAQGPLALDNVTAALETLRELKNEIFFKSIAPKCLERLK